MTGKVETLEMFGTDHSLALVKKKTMDAARDKGCDCPVCGQFVKVYRRTITSTMARQLIHVHNLFGLDEWFHTRHTTMGGSSAGDFSKLEYWGLINRMPHAAGEDGKKSSGMWKVTLDGGRFLNGFVGVQKYALVYNGKALSFEGESISIQSALGDKFDDGELMQPVGRSAVVYSQPQGFVAQ